MSFYSGNALYSLSEFEQAIEHFERSEKASINLEHKSKCIENIAVCHVALGNLQEAIKFFEIAMSLTPGTMNSLMINNLAGIYNATNEPHRALETLDALKDVELEEPTKRYVEINRMAALKNLSDTLKLQHALSEFLQAYPVPEYPQEVSEVVESMLSLDQREAFKDYRPRAQALVDANRDFAEEWMPELYPILRLSVSAVNDGFENMPFEARWELAQILHESTLSLRRNSRSNDKSDDLQKRLNESLNREQKREMQVWGLLGLALAFAGISAFSIYQRLQVKRLRKSYLTNSTHRPRIESSHHAIASIREAITSGRNINTALVHLSAIDTMINGEPQKVSIRDSNLPELGGLTASEITILEHIGQNLSAKESSILLGVSTGHIYNVRSSIREKLGLEKEVELRDWLLERLDAASILSAKR